MNVTIIGAGLAGMTTAYYLNRAGVSVTVIDRQPAGAMETSFANGAMISPGLADPWNSPGVWKTLLKSLGQDDSAMLLRLKALPGLVTWGLKFLASSSQRSFENSFTNNINLVRYSQQQLHDLLQTHPVSMDHNVDGVLKVYRSKEAFEDGLVLAEFAQRAGVSYRQLDQNQILDVEPALDDAIDALVGGIHSPMDESADAHKFVTEVAQICKQSGVEFIFNRHVSGFQCAENKIMSVQCDGDDRTNELPTDIPTDHVVIAAGSYSPILTRMLGFDLPIKPAKGYSLTLSLPNWSKRPGLPVVDDALHAAVVPVGNRIRVAGTAEFCGYDQSLTAARVDNLKRLLTTIYPATADHLKLEDGQAWCGFRPVTTDSMPILGPSPVINCSINAGHGPLGWSMACASGRLVSDLISGSTPDIPTEPWLLKRFG